MMGNLNLEKSTIAKIEFITMGEYCLKNMNLMRKCKI